MIYCTKRPSKKKQGVYHLLFIPTHIWEIFSMEFVGGLQTNRKGNDYFFLIVYRFNKMCVLVPCKNTINGKERN